MNNEELTTTIDRLAAAASALEQLAQRLTETDEATIGRIVAQVEDRRTLELEQKLAAAEQLLAEREEKIAQLEAAAAGAPSFRAPGSPASSLAGVRAEGGERKTIPATTATLLAKQGLTVDTLEAGTLDAALNGLSLEQRIAVKSQLLRAGLLA